MLPQFYQDHFKSQLHPAQYLLLTLLVQLLQTIKQAKLETLATSLPLPILFESRRRKIQRFLSLPALCIETLWFPVIVQWLKVTFGQDKTLYVVIDRTRWMNIRDFQTINCSNTILLYRQYPQTTFQDLVIPPALDL
jgi:hypothetical protein